jgi:dTDP-glucose 4,6-dehydratase
VSSRETWIVAGGAGFIGSNFVRAALASSDARVVVLDKLTYAGSLESLRDVEKSPRFSFVQGDIADARALRALFAAERPRYVVNFAAETHVDRSIDGPRAFVETNMLGHVRDPRGGAGPRAGRGRAFRFLHVSTDEVYGSLGDTGAFREDTPYAPNSPYSASKAAADHLVRTPGHETYGLPTLITNCSNNYGPYQFPEKLVPLMIMNALEGQAPARSTATARTPRLALRGRSLRRHPARAAPRRARATSTTSAATAERDEPGSSCDALCALLDERVRRPPRTRAAGRGLSSYADLKTFVPDRPGHDRRYAIDASKIRAELGWKAKHDVRGGIHATVAWYLDNAGWCEAVHAASTRATDAARARSREHDDEGHHPRGRQRHAPLPGHARGEQAAPARSTTSR